MMKLKYLNIILILAAFLTFSCRSHKDKNYSKKAIELNNLAMKIMLSNPDSALTLLNKATNVDNDYYIAHNNKVNIHISRGEIDKAIKSAEQGVKAKPDLAEAVTMLGMLYDYKGQKDKAQKEYSKALEIYNNRLESSSENRMANKMNRAQTLFLLGKQNEGQMEIKELLKESPDNPSLKMLMDFNKDKYLNNLFRQE